MIARHSGRCILSVPLSQLYFEGLHKRWPNPKPLSHHTCDGRALATMQNASIYRLNQIPIMEPCIRSLIASPVEVLPSNYLLMKCYYKAACMDRVGNSLSHLMSPFPVPCNPLALLWMLLYRASAYLQAFAFMTRELGRLMLMLTLTCHQVWLAQSPLSDPCQ